MPLPLTRFSVLDDYVVRICRLFKVSYEGRSFLLAAEEPLKSTIKRGHNPLYYTNHATKQRQWYCNFAPLAAESQQFT